MRVVMTKRGVQQHLIKVHRRLTPITSAALNRALRGATTILVRSIAADMGIKQKRVRRREMWQRFASKSHLVASVHGSGKRVPLIEFKARGPKRPTRRSRGVTAKVQGSRKRYPRAFIATMRSGHRGVFERAPGAGRLPIVEKHGPSVGQVMRRFYQAGHRRGLADFNKSLAHQLRRLGAA